MDFYYLGPWKINTFKQINPDTKAQVGFLQKKSKTTQLRKIQNLIFLSSINLRNQRAASPCLIPENSQENTTQGNENFTFFFFFLGFFLINQTENNWKERKKEE